MDSEIPKTQKQSSELILYRLNELTNTVKEMNNKLDDQSKQYVVKTEFDAFKKTVRINYVSVALIVSTLVTIVYHLAHIAP